MAKTKDKQITKKEVIELLDTGRKLWYYYLKGFVLLSPLVYPSSTGTITIPMKLFLELKQAGSIKCSEKKHYDSEMYRAHYQVYTLV